MLFIKESDVKIIVSDKSKEYINVPKATDDKKEIRKPVRWNNSTGTSIPSSTPTPTNNPYNEGDGVGYWVVVDGKAVELFKFNKDNFDFYAQVLNKYNQKIGGKVPIYSLIAPTNSEFVQLRNYKGITDSQNNAIAYLNSKFSEEITAVNAYDVLNEHKDEYIYFRSDHHWTALGAYYAYTAFMETKGEPIS